MKLIVGEWVNKAEGDFASVLRETRARKTPNYDGACFHAQQCAEKYIKARLCDANMDFAKIHDLVALLEQVLPVEPMWEVHRKDFAYLCAFAITFRYPGESADKKTAKDALQRCRRFRQAARKSLGLQSE